MGQIKLTKRKDRQFIPRQDIKEALDKFSLKFVWNTHDIHRPLKGIEIDEVFWEEFKTDILGKDDETG